MIVPNESLIRLLVPIAGGLAGAIFGAGATYGVFRARFLRLLKDFNGLGEKVARIERHDLKHRDEVEARRFHNLSLAIKDIAPEEKQTALSALLKE